MKTRIIAVATLLAFAGTAHAQLAEWDNNAGGFWTDAANWDPMTVPNASSFAASIALPGTYDVLLTSSLTIGTLLLTNPNASVSIEFSDTLAINSGITNNGEIVVNNNAAAAVTALLMQSPRSPIAGTGSLRLNGFSTRARLLTDAGADIVHGSGHMIHGYGQIQAAIENNGLIQADVPGQTLIIQTEPITNNATMRATNTGILDIDNFTLTQSPSGLIVADGGSVLMAGIDLSGGSVDTINAGSFLINGSSTFSGVTINGPLALEVGDTLGIISNLTNNAALTINNNAAGAVTTLTFLDASTLGGTGEVVLNGFSIRARILANAGTLTHQAPHRIRGFGVIEGVIDNNAPITADVAGQQLNLTGSTLNNTAVLSATGTSTLNIDNTTIDNASGGTIVADNGTVLYGNVTVIGGVVDTINGGASLIDLSSAFDGVALNGDVSIEVGDTLTIRNGLANNAILTVNNNAGGLVTDLFFEDSSALTGSGTVVLNGFSSRARLTATEGETITHASPHTIRGYGQILADMVNNSLVSADVTNQTMSVDNVTIDNNATIQAAAGGTIDLNGSTIDNQTGVIRADAGTLRIGSTNINGGTLESVNGGTSIVDVSSAFDAVTIEGPLTIEVADTLAVTNGLTNNAVLTVNNNAGGAVTSLRFDDNSTLEGTGTVVLNGFLNRARLFGLDGTITATQASTHTIAGEGRIEVALINNGTIAPGFPGVTPIREMLATEDITNTASANYIVEVQGNNISDLIDSSAAYHADGTLNIGFINAFDPANYWNTSIIQADGGVTGRYDTVNAPQPTDPRLEFRVIYSATEIRIGAFCKGDTNADGLLNFFDVTTFIAAFNAGDPDADIAVPFGTLNFFDLLGYIARFNTGCP